MEVKKIQAYVVLAKQFIIHIVKKVAPQTQSGANDFLKNYHKDRIFVIPAEIRTQMPEYSQCYACRLCDTVCPELMTMPPQKTAPSTIVMGVSRSLTDYAYFKDSAPECSACHLCESACPESVPIRALIDFMKIQGQALRGSAL